jgi:hypothetical protein
MLKQLLFHVLLMILVDEDLFENDSVESKVYDVAVTL